MRKNWLYLGFLVLVLFSGCQKTPEEEIVVGKNNGELESMIHETNAENKAELNSENEKIEETRPEIETIAYSDRFTGADPEVEVSIEADIRVSNTNMPVVRVKPHDITMEEVKKWAEVFFEGETAYEYDARRTKEELEALILDLKQYLGDEETLLEDCQGNMELLAHIKETVGRDLAVYEELYKETPDELVKKEVEWTFKPNHEYEPELGEPDDEMNGTMRIKLMADVDGVPMYLDVKKRIEEDYQMQILRVMTDGYYQSTPLEETEEEVDAFVSEKLKAVGLDHWELEAYEPYFIPGDSDSKNEAYKKNRYYHILTYAPVYGGEKVIQQQQLGGSENIEAYDFKYGYESLSVHVSNGRIIWLQWESPLEVVSVENENVKTLSYKEALERFQKQMEVQATMSSLTNTEEGYVAKKAEIRIRQVEFGLARVKVQNSRAEYYLLPVWNFKGELGHDDGNGMVYESEIFRSLFQDYSFMTINAIDGSVINVEDGY